MSKNLSQYFIWERPCFPGLVYTPAEAVTVPHIKEFGYPWDDTLCFFSNGMIRAVWRIEVMTQNGAKITQKFLDPQYFLAKIKHHDELMRKLASWFERVNTNALAKLSDEEYLVWWKDYNDDFRNWWGFAQVSDLIGMGSEFLLKQKFTLSPEQMNVLTTPTRKSYTTVEEEEMLNIVYCLLEKKDPNQLLKEHSEKYFWMLNSYADTKYLDEKYFFSVAEDIIKKGIGLEEKEKIKKNNETRLIEIKEKSRALQTELKMTEQDKKLVKFIDYFTCFQDDRKAFSIKANHYTDLFMKELGRRAGLHYDLVKFICPQEYADVLRGGFELMRLKTRQKHFSIFFKATGTEIYEGTESEKQEQNVLGIEIDKNLSEFEGVRAMGGKVVGRVRKIMQLADLGTMQNDEILVTTMTSPDFVVAMRKAKAIVTDQGGVTCHAAVISRELGLPCVIGTSIATRVLNTGDLVEVRANHGIVRILERH